MWGCGDVGIWGAASRHLREHLDPLLRRALLHAHRVHVVVPALALHPAVELVVLGLRVAHVPRPHPDLKRALRADAPRHRPRRRRGVGIDDRRRRRHPEDGGARRPRLGALFGGVAVLVFGPLQSAEAFGEDRPRRQRLHELAEAEGLAVRREPHVPPVQTVLPQPQRALAPARGETAARGMRGVRSLARAARRAAAAAAPHRRRPTPRPTPPPRARART